MKINLAKQMVWGGEPVRRSPEDDAPILTLKMVLVGCLGMMRVDNGEGAIQAFVLGCDIQDAESEFEPKAEELILLRKAVEQNAMNYRTFVVGQVLLMLQD